MLFTNLSKPVILSTSQQGHSSHLKVSLGLPTVGFITQHSHSSQAPPTF